MWIFETLPKLYENVLPKELNIEIPDESFATCNNCSMTCGIKPHSSNNYFSPNSKCCTFHPHLPNYLVGFILNSSDPTLLEGQKRIIDMIKKKTGVFPSGMYPSKKYQSLHLNYSVSIFGKSDSFLCPFYIKDGGLCSIWKGRDSICSTYFCIHSAGEDGRRMWASLNKYLSFVQECLGQYALRKLNYMAIQPESAVIEDPNQHLAIEDFDEVGPSEESYRERWGTHSPKEQNFYIACYNSIINLNARKFSNIMGIKGKKLLNDIIFQNQKVETVPRVLKRNVNSIAIKNEEGIWKIMLSRSRFAINISDDIVNLFDGTLGTNEVITKANKLGLDTNDLEEKVFVLYHYNFFIKG